MIPFRPCNCSWSLTICIDFWASFFHQIFHNMTWWRPRSILCPIDYWFFRRGDFRTMSPIFSRLAKQSLFLKTRSLVFLFSVKSKIIIRFAPILKEVTFRTLPRLNRISDHFTLSNTITESCWQCSAEEHRAAVLNDDKPLSCVFVQ